MSEMEEKLNAVLNNPQMMQQIMSMAQSMGTQNQPSRDTTPKIDGFPDIDPGMIKKLSSFAGQSSIDQDQQTLLKALGPYLSRERIGKLEKAMRAAKLARLATGLIGSGGLSF